MAEKFRTGRRYVSKSGQVKYLDIEGTCLTKYGQCDPQSIQCDTEGYWVVPEEGYVKDTSYSHRGTDLTLYQGDRVKVLFSGSPTALVLLEVIRYEPAH